MIGSELRTQRESHGLSQAKLAEGSGVAQHLISAFELGKANLSASDLEAVKFLLQDGVKLAELIGRKKRYKRSASETQGVRDDRSKLQTQTLGNMQYVEYLSGLEHKRKCGETNGLSALSLFSGVGGFSLGFSWAGFKVKGFVELEAGLRKIYQSNFPDAYECGSDITKISCEQLDSIAEKVGEIDVIIGGPPCQGFSLSGKRDVSDPRNVLFKHYLRFVDKFRPKMAILENVRLLTSMKNKNGGYVRDDILDEFGRHGYSVKFFEVNAKEYGVPQHRERVIFVATSNEYDLKPSLPEAPFGETSDLFNSKSKFRTFADACSDLEFLESGGKSKNDRHHVAVKHPEHVIEWLWNVEQGKSAHDNEDPEMRPPSGYNTTYKRQIWDEPGSTVQTTFGMISGCRNVHPIATRSLTIREAARIQSFPDAFKLSGTAGTMRTGIGNAVPPLLAYELGKHVEATISNLVPR